MIFDVTIIGGGPAGAAAAITAARSGARVLLLERGRFPRHKVCGEFISAEGVVLLGQLGLMDLLCSAGRVAWARIFAAGSIAQFPLAPPAAPISRYKLDHALWLCAVAAGALCREQVAVRAITGRTPFVINTSSDVIIARSVINASGRWSSLRRTALLQRTPKQWIGWKQHFRQPGPSGSVDLYFFPEGYCGVQPLGGGQLNACAMVRAHRAASLDDVFDLHAALRERSLGWEPVSDSVSTSPLVFAPPEAEEGGVLFAGDAAGFIDPFVGDGISLALRSGVMAAQALVSFWRGEKTLTEAIAGYRAEYERDLHPVFRNSRWLRRLTAVPRPLHKPLMAALGVPGVMPYLISRTRPPSIGQAAEIG